MIKKINATAKTPEVVVDQVTGEIKVVGVLIPENPIPIFTEIMNLTKECINQSQILTIDLDLEYFNTGAARYLYDYLKTIKTLSNVEINWYYECDDEDIFDSGTEFQAMTGLKFNFIEKK